jgi:diguanylate cyclase (GGDEF)-like protein/PAS domain S-box-containing protein
VDNIGTEQLLAGIAATSRDCLVCTDRDDVVVWASPAVEEVLGWDPAELVGRPYAVLVPAGASEVLHDSVTRALAGERTTSFVDVRRRRDGALVEMDVALGPLHAADGSVVGVTRILHDRAGHETASVEGLAAQQHLFQALARRSWDAAIVVDEALRVRYAAPPVGGMLGYGADELVGTSAWSVLHPDDVPGVRPLVERVVAMADHTERFLVRVRDRSGGWRWIEQTLTNCLTDPEIGGIVVTLRDLTDQVETERLLRFSEALHRAIVETVQEGILATAPDGATMLANEKLAEILGLPLETLNTCDVHALLGRALRVEAALDPLESVRGPERYETTYAHPDGRERVLQVTRSLLHHPGGPETLGWLSLVSDVTEARRVEQELRRRALHDPLTGLPNRHLVLDRLRMAAARQERTPGATTAVLFLDLDGFKPINDSRGHEAGDELLIEVGSRLTAAVRASDTVARIGGDEFAVICENADEDAVRVVAERVQAALAEPVVLSYGEPLRASASIGVALSPPYAVGDLLRVADGAMYDAKQLGGGRTALAPGPADRAAPRVGG